MTGPPATLRWSGPVDGDLILLDQTELPGAVVERTCRTAEDVWEAIRALRVRGAPAIGIAAAYGVVLGTHPFLTDHVPAVMAAARKAADLLATSRPTAVNLFWALDRMRTIVDTTSSRSESRALAERLLTEAQAIHDEDRRQCAAIGHAGAALLDLLPDAAGILTHCNTGALATGGEGTALAIIFALQAAGKRIRVYVDETRPLLQGARLTAWELVQRGIDATLICDSMAAQVLREGRVQAVLVGADRIAANGDVANKIGTYGLAVTAAAHDVPFYVAAPTSTFDLALDAGDQIPIEERSGAEVTQFASHPIAPAGIRAYNPAFDVTPARLIRALICERGVVAPVTGEQIRKMVTP